MENYPVADNFKRGLKKPTVKMIGEDGNIFNLMAIARRGLRHMPAAFNEMRDRIFKAKSYDESLQIMMDYLEIE